MRRNITVFADEDIVEALTAVCEGNRQFGIGYVAHSGDDIFEPSAAGDAVAIIIQARSEVAQIMELFMELDHPGFSPILLLFEKTGEGEVSYAVTDPAASYSVGRVTMLFENALEGKYRCVCHNFRRAMPDNGFREETANLARVEALCELLRGCPSGEIETYKHMYSLDLRDNGYYLFFWELQGNEYAKHRDNKDVYNFVGDMLEMGIMRILSEYAGGEVFCVTLNKRCVIINDLTIRSDAARQSKFEELASRLTAFSRNNTTSCYLSDRVESLLDLRRVRDQYESEKSCVFFLRNVGLVRPQTIKAMRSKQRGAMDMVLPQVHRIGRYIHYDIMNPELINCLHSLYFDIIKPTMDYTLYTFCVAAICSELVKESDEFDMDVLTENLNPEQLRFSSIEEQYRIMCGRIASLQMRTKTRRNTRNTLVLQAMEYIAANYNKDITVPQIANALYVSHIYLSQIFKSLLGESIISYIVNYRIEQAKNRLEETDEMIYDIAEAVGFHDPKHFSKTFKSIVGMTPSQYRSHVRKH